MIRRYTLLLVISFFVLSNVWAQEQLKHPIKFYTDSEGRLFVNKSMPLYVWLSTSPDPNCEKQRLKSESSPQYSNPFYFDTEGYNTFRTPSQVDTVTKKVILPKRDIIFEVYTDSEAPVLKQNYGEAPLYRKDGKLYCGKNTVVNIADKDKMSGTDLILKSIDGSDFTKYSGEIPFNSEKDYVFKYYAVDNVGNVGKIKTLEFTVDVSSPKTVSEVIGTDYHGILNTSSKIKLTATDNSSGVNKVFYKIDNGSKRTYTGRIALSSLTEGDHTITFYSVDNVKNTENENQYKFFLDKTAPMVIKEVLGDQYIINGKVVWSGRTKLQLTAVDNKAGVKEIMYSLSGEEYLKYSKPFYLPKKRGSHSIKYYAHDNVGNKSTGDNRGGKNSGFFVVDLTGPSLKYSYVGKTFVIQDTVYCNTDTKVKLIATDAEVGIKQIDYSLDSGSDIVYDTPFSNKNEGFHTVQYTGTDNVNNTNTASLYFFIDDTGPDIFDRFSIVPIDSKTEDGKKLDVYPSHLVLFLSATDKLVGVDRIYYAINGKPEKLYGALISGFHKTTKYNIKIRGVDKLGNEKTKEIEFFIE